jgi:hypothetical protein
MLYVERNEFGALQPVTLQPLRNARSVGVADPSSAARESARGPRED